MLRSCLFKLYSFFPCQPHGRCKGSSRQLNKESGHWVGILWSPCQCCSTSKCRAGFNLHTLEVGLSRLVYLCDLQGTIFSKTAMQNYKDLGPQLFRMSVPHCPAKRLGVPEEVCNCRKTHTPQEKSFIKQKRKKKPMLYFINEIHFVLMLCLCSDIISSVFPTLTCCLLHFWSHPEGGCRTESVPFNVGGTRYVDLVNIYRTHSFPCCVQKR